MEINQVAEVEATKRAVGDLYPQCVCFMEDDMLKSAYHDLMGMTANSLSALMLGRNICPVAAPYFMANVAALALAQFESANVENEDLKAIDSLVDKEGLTQSRAYRQHFTDKSLKNAKLFIDTFNRIAPDLNERANDYADAIQGEA